MRCGFPCPPRFRNLTDAGITGEYEFASTHRSLLEIGRVRWQHLPPGNFLPEQLNGSHVGKLLTQALVMVVRGREPDAIVGGVSRLLAQDENNFFADVNCSATEHRARDRREFSDGVENEFVRNWFASFDRERIVRRERWRFAARLRHSSILVRHRIGNIGQDTNRAGHSGQPCFTS